MASVWSSYTQGNPAFVIACNTSHSQCILFSTPRILPTRIGLSGIRGMEEVRIKALIVTIEGVFLTLLITVWEPNGPSNSRATVV